MLTSVVVPVYNSERFIDGCIDILSSQTSKNFEVVFVVDERSTDDSRNKLESVNDAAFPFRILIQTDDDRLSGARNLGIDDISGDYVWFMDIDDRPCDTFIEEMTEIMEKNDCDIAVCNFRYSHQFDDYEPPAKEYKIREYDSNGALIALNDGSLPIMMWNKVFRTSFIKENNLYFVKGYCEDYDYMMRSFLKTDKIVYYNKPLYSYLLHNGSMSVGNGDLIAERDIEIFTQIANVIKEERPDFYEEFCSIALIHILRSLTNADKGAFLRLSDAEIIKESLRYKQNKFSSEVFLFKLSKRLFHFVGRNARKMKFSRKELLFNEDI